MSRQGRSYSVCQPLSEPQEDADRFYELMKSAAPDDKNAPGDTDRTTVGVNPDPYPDPVDRGEGTTDALWGDKDDGGRGTSEHFTNAAWRGFKQSREKFLEKNLDSFESSAEGARKTLAQNLDHFQSGDFEARKPFLKEHSDRQPEVVDTVLDKTVRLLDHP